MTYQKFTYDISKLIWLSKNIKSCLNHSENDIIVNRWITHTCAESFHSIYALIYWRSFHSILPISNCQILNTRCNILFLFLWIKIEMCCTRYAWHGVAIILFESRWILAKVFYISSGHSLDFTLSKNVFSRCCKLANSGILCEIAVPHLRRSTIVQFAEKNTPKDADCFLTYQSAITKKRIWGTRQWLRNTPALPRYLRASRLQIAEVCHIPHKFDVSREGRYFGEQGVVLEIT